MELFDSQAGSDTRIPRLVLSCERGGYPRVIKKKPPTERDYIKQNLEDDEVLEEGKEGKESKNSKTSSRETGSKRIGCPFCLKGHYLPEFNQWMLEVACGVHNHPQAKYLEGHAYAGRLTSDEEKLVASLSSSHTHPKQILAAIQRSFPNNKSTIKTIYNVRSRNKYVEHAGRSQMQYLLGKLEEYGYYQYTRWCPQTDTVKDMFYVHPTSVKLLRAFPGVLLKDCTYKTNMYRLPLFEIVGVTSTSMTFSVACAYLEGEKEDNYIWALTVLKGLMDQSTLPSVIVTDQERALMNAIEVTFPTARHFLCRWHINKNITANFKKKFRTKDQWESFLSAWNLVVLAETEARYGEMLRRFQEDYATNPTVIVPYKERFVSYWTNRVMHFDNTTTCWAEGAHAKLKRFLGTSTGNLEGCWEKIHDLLETSFNAIKASFEKSINVVQHRYKSLIFQFLRGTISIAALDKIHEEMKSIGKDGVDPLLCGCVMRTKCGLPCAHEIDQHVRSSMPFSLDSVDKFWRKLDMEPTGANIVVATDVDNHWFETWNCANNMFAQADESERLLMLKRFREIVTSSTTSMVESDVQTKTCGRPKVTKTKADTSTKREKSAFEYTDSFNDSCSQVPDSFECGTSLLQAMFTTRPQKQKAIRPKASYHLGIGYIDQIPASFRGYVVRTQDVNADGHCGFRAIAGLVLGDQESWSRVRSDLFYEINSNPEMWDKCFLERGRREKVLKILNFHDLTAPTRHWFVLPDLGHVVATVYKVALVTLGGRYPTTFLPLSSSVLVEPKCICMAHVKIGEGHCANHFIQVFMNPNHPFPPISAQWKDFRMDCAAGWEDFVTRP
ncbi:hypothetical protein C2S52_011373 [Perilla frutescens var. hirtella]|nr:hypothetical protein C2S52_011373 [Perilla frutescens var. hirtella]